MSESDMVLKVIYDLSEKNIHKSIGCKDIKDQTENQNQINIQGEDFLNILKVLSDRGLIKLGCSFTLTSLISNDPVSITQKGLVR